MEQTENVLWIDFAGQTKNRRGSIYNSVMAFTNTPVLMHRISGALCIRCVLVIARACHRGIIYTASLFVMKSHRKSLGYLKIFLRLAISFEAALRLRSAYEKST